MHILFFIAGVLLLGYSLAVNLLEGYIAFHSVMGLAGAFFILLSIFWKKLKQSRWGKMLSNVFLWLLGIGCAVFLVAEGFIISGVLSKAETTPQYTVILGAGLRGTELSRSLKSRLDTALACDSGEVFVVTGGQGRGESLPEGEAMAAYLIENGIPSDRILIEDKSTSTWENFCNSKPIIEAHAGDPVDDLAINIVTSEFHCFRAKLIARRAGYGDLSAEGSATPLLIAPGCYAREAFALIKTLLLDR